MNKDWLSSSKIKNIDEEKLEILSNLLESSEGNSPEDLIPKLVAANTRLKQIGKNFTHEETELILDTLKDGMTNSEKNRMEIIKNIFKRNIK